jgi:ketosteroid isomerase-like protein
MIPKDRSRDAAEVRAVVDAWVAAVRRKDVDAMLAHCAPGVATFDLVPPLAHRGKAAVRDVWLGTFAAFEPPLEYDTHDLEMTVGDDVAFVRSLNRFGGRRTGGDASVQWMRSTLGFQKIEGRWKLVHEHVSVPFDMESGRALLDLEPEGAMRKEEGGG